MPVWRTGAYGWGGAAGRASHSFRRMMLNEASPQMCVSILSCLEAESLIGKWFPYPGRQKNKRLLELSHPLPLICCRMTQPLPSFSFLWVSSCLPVYQVPEWKRQMCAVIVSYPAWRLRAFNLSCCWEQSAWQRWLVVGCVDFDSQVYRVALYHRREDMMEFITAGAHGRSCLQLTRKPVNRLEPGSGANFQDPSPSELLLPARLHLPNTPQLLKQCHKLESK